MKVHRYTDAQRQQLETSIDFASVILTSLDMAKPEDVSLALAQLAKGAAIVREIPEGFRRIRSDEGTKRENLPPRVVGV